MARNPTLFEQVAQVAHEAVRLWRQLRGEPHVQWSETTGAHREAYATHVAAVVGGATSEQLHQMRAADGLVDPQQDLGAQLKETALVHAVAQTLGCGQERWAVKTGSDPSASNVNMTVKQTTIAELVAFAPPPPDPPARVAGGPECQLYAITATIDQAKMELDSDYHLALSDGQGNTMIAEAACPGCATRSPWLAQIQQVRDAIDAAIPALVEEYQPVGREATITGVGFFDRPHGQAGVAPNAIELHPILAIEFH